MSAERDKPETLKDEDGKEYQPFPSEFKPTGSPEEVIAQYILGFPGRMVGGSKSIYRYDNPKNLVVFNANVVMDDKRKIWYGDLDLTLSSNDLLDLAEDLGETIHVLSESDARFENEANPNIENAVATYRPDRTASYKDSEYIYEEDGVPYVKPIEPTSEEPELLEEAEYEPIPLPDLSSFKVTKKGKDPMTQFQDYFRATYGEDAVNVYLNLFLTKTYMEGLEDLATKYAKKLYPNAHPVKIEQSVAWLMLETAPMDFNDTQPWEKPNTGYVRKEKKHV